MSRSVWPLASADEMRELDRHTIETLGVPGALLMESAGRAVAEAALALGGGRCAVTVVCGGGNNGGDGLVAARHLHQRGVPVRLVLLKEPGRLRGDPADNWARAEAVGLSLEGPRWRPAPGEVVIDAVFGTGLGRDVTGPPANAIRRMQAARERGARVVAVDLPSGVCADTGRERGVAVRADVTVTLGLPKLGLALEPGRSLAGEVRVAHIGIAERTPALAPRAVSWTRRGAAEALPERPPAGHKGTFGHALLVAGSEGKTGAAALAAAGAARIGAGLVTIGCPAGVHDVLETKCTEAMTAPLPDLPGRALAAGAESAILSLAAGRDAMGLGPGLGRDPETLGLVRALAKHVEVPLVLDADALVAFAEQLELLAERAAPTVVTPHPGEAAAMLGTRPAEINRDRVGAARRLAERTGAVVLLKGAATLTVRPDGSLVANPTGGPILGSGGTGDVLTGLVTGLLAQGLAADRAAALAAWVHGAAADAIAARIGPSGLMAGDLADEVPAETARLRRAAVAAERDIALAAAFPDA